MKNKVRIARGREIAASEIRIALSAINRQLTIHLARRGAEREAFNPSK